LLAVYRLFPVRSSRTPRWAESVVILATLPYPGRASTGPGAHQACSYWRVTCFSVTAVPRGAAARVIRARRRIAAWLTVVIGLPG